VAYWIIAGHKRGENELEAAPVLDTREVNNVSVTKPQLSQGNG